MKKINYYAFCFLFTVSCSQKKPVEPTNEFSLDCKSPINEVPGCFKTAKIKVEIWSEDLNQYGYYKEFQLQNAESSQYLVPFAKYRFTVTADCDCGRQISYFERTPEVNERLNFEVDCYWGNRQLGNCE
jgi:hypothetical protein